MTRICFFIVLGFVLSSYSQIRADLGRLYVNESASKNDTCFPPCRSGFICHNGSCVELCNPPCPEGEICTGTSAGSGECVQKVQKSVVPDTEAENHPTRERATESLYDLSPQDRERAMNSLYDLSPQSKSSTWSSKIKAQSDTSYIIPPSGLTFSFGYGGAHGGLGVTTVNQNPMKSY